MRIGAELLFRLLDVDPHEDFELAGAGRGGLSWRA